MFVISSNSWFAKKYSHFKWSVYTLLYINMFLFFMTQTIVEGIESLAWLVLLMLFEWETSQMDKPYVTKFEQYSIHLGRIIAYVFILYSAYEYTTKAFIAENGSLDMYNAITWLLIVILLEYDLYVPGNYYRWEWVLRNTLKIGLYTTLFVIAILWWIDGNILDFYDAVLWIVCFFFIELNIFTFEDEQPYEEEALQEEETPASQDQTESKTV